MTTYDTARKVADGDILQDGWFNGISGIRDVEAGETIAAGDVVFIYMSGHANEGEAWLSDADVQDKCRVSGIAVTGGNDGDTIQIMTKGIYVTSGLTAKKNYYLSTTAGDWTTTASGVRIGQAISTTELFVDIVQDDRDVVGTIKPFLKDHANMVSNPLTAFWKLCDGTAISDAESPLNGGQAPYLNNSVFLRGAATSDDGTDNTSGGGTHVHQWYDGSGSGTGASSAIDVNSAVDDQTYDSSGSVTDLVPEGGGWLDMNAYTSAVTGQPPFMDMVFIMKIK